MNKHTIAAPRFSVALRPGWQAVGAPASGDLATGVLGTFTGDGHVLVVERVGEGWIPLKAAMGQVALASRRHLLGYEVSESEAVDVVGAVAARERIAITEESAGSYLLRERYIQGGDQGMWYVRIVALRHEYNADIAERALRGFVITVSPIQPWKGPSNVQ